MTREGPASKVSAVGGSVKIALPESPTTGYRWNLEDKSDRVQVINSKFEEGQSKPKAGGGGMRVFYLDLLGAEPLRLRFVLRRQWESEPIERRVITVIFTDV